MDEKHSESITLIDRRTESVFYLDCLNGNPWSIGFDRYRIRTVNSTRCGKYDPETSLVAGGWFERFSDDSTKRISRYGSR